VVYSHGWCIVMGSVLSWVVYCHGWCTLMGGVLSWVVYCHANEGEIFVPIKT